MKKLAIITLFSYIALAIFGFVGMHEHSSFNACLRTAFPTSMPCAGSSTNDVAAAQAGIYQSFSMSTAFSLVLLFALLAVALIHERLAERTEFTAAFSYSAHAHQATPAYQKLSDWFTVFQKRDPNLV